MNTTIIALAFGVAFGALYQSIVNQVQIQQLRHRFEELDQKEKA